MSRDVGFGVGQRIGIDVDRCDASRAEFRRGNGEDSAAGAEVGDEWTWPFKAGQEAEHAAGGCVLTRAERHARVNDDGPLGVTFRSEPGWGHAQCPDLVGADPHAPLRHPIVRGAVRNLDRGVRIHAGEHVPNQPAIYLIGHIGDERCTLLRDALRPGVHQRRYQRSSTIRVGRPAWVHADLQPTICHSTYAPSASFIFFQNPFARVCGGFDSALESCWRSACSAGVSSSGVHS